MSIQQQQKSSSSPSLSEDGSIRVAVPFIKGGVPYLTPDQVNDILSAEEGERLLMAAYFDLASCVAPCEQFSASSSSSAASGDTNEKKKIAVIGNPLLAFSGYQPKDAADYKLILGLRSSSLGAHTVTGGGGGKEAAGGSDANNNNKKKDNNSNNNNASSPPPIIYGETDSGRLSLSLEAWQKAVEVLKPDYALSLHNAVSVDSILLKQDNGEANTTADVAEVEAAVVDAEKKSTIAAAGAIYSSPASVTSLVTTGKKKLRLTAEKNRDWGELCEQTVAASTSPTTTTTVVLPLSGLALQQGLCTSTTTTATPDDDTTTTTPTAVLPEVTAVYVDSVNLGETLQERYNTLSLLQQKKKSSTVATNNNMMVISMGDSVVGILTAYINKVTVVDCYFPFTMAIKGHALNLGALTHFILSAGNNKTSSSSSVVVGEKRPRSEEDGELANIESTSVRRVPFVLDLRNPLHRLDFTALCSSKTNNDSTTTAQCPCYTCKRHTNGYIYHLINVQEMNSSALLVMHNLTQVVMLCRALRTLAKSVGGDAAREVVVKALEAFCKF